MMSKASSRAKVPYATFGADDDESDDVMEYVDRAEPLPSFANGGKYGKSDSRMKIMPKTSSARRSKFGRKEKNLDQYLQKSPPSSKNAKALEPPKLVSHASAPISAQHYRNQLDKKSTMNRKNSLRRSSTMSEARSEGYSRKNSSLMEESQPDDSKQKISFLASARSGNSASLQQTELFQSNSELDYDKTLGLAPTTTDNLKMKMKGNLDTNRGRQRKDADLSPSKRRSRTQSPVVSTGADSNFLKNTPDNEQFKTDHLTELTDKKLKDADLVYSVVATPSSLQEVENENKSKQVMQDLKSAPFLTERAIGMGSQSPENVTGKTETEACGLRSPQNTKTFSKSCRKLLLEESGSEGVRCDDLVAQQQKLFDAAKQSSMNNCITDSRIQKEALKNHPADDAGGKSPYAVSSSINTKEKYGVYEKKMPSTSQPKITAKRRKKGILKPTAMGGTSVFVAAKFAPNKNDAAKRHYSYARIKLDANAIINAREKFNFAVQHLDYGRLDEAEECLFSTLKDHWEQQTRTGYSIDVGMIHSQLAVITERRGELSKAVKHIEEAVKNMEGMLSHHHRNDEENKCDVDVKDNNKIEVGVGDNAGQISSGIIARLRVEMERLYCCMSASNENSKSEGLEASQKRSFVKRKYVNPEADEFYAFPHSSPQHTKDNNEKENEEESIQKSNKQEYVPQKKFNPIALEARKLRKLASMEQEEEHESYNAVVGETKEDVVSSTDLHKEVDDNSLTTNEEDQHRQTRDQRQRRHKPSNILNGVSSSLATSREVDDSSFFAQGETLFRTADYESAMGCFERALKERKLEYGKESQKVAYAEEKLGDVSMALSDPIESQFQYSNALKRLQRSGLTIQGLKSNSEKPESSNKSYNSKNAILRIVTKLGDVHLRRGEYTFALVKFEEALEEMKRRAHFESADRDTEDIGGEMIHHVHGGMAKCHRELAEAYARVQNYKVAVGHYEESINLMDLACDGNDDKLEIALVSNALGDACFEMNAFPEALENYEEAMASLEEAGVTETLDVASTLQSLGETHARMGNYQDAVTNYNKALKILDSEDLNYDVRPITRATLQYRIANCHYIAKNDEDSLEMFQDALFSFGESEETAQVREDCTNAIKKIAALYTKRGDLENVLECYDDLANFLEHSKSIDYLALVSSLQSKACMEFKLKRYDKSMETFEKSLVVLQKLAASDNADVKPEVSSSILRCIGAAAFCCGKLGKALICLEKCVEHMDSYEKVTIISSMAIIHGKQYNFENSLKCFHDALSIINEKFEGKHPEVTSIHINRGNVLHYQEKFDSCLDAYDEAKDILSRMEEKPKMQWAGLNFNMGVTKFKIGDFQAAKDQLEATLECNLGNDDNANDGAVDLAAVLNSLANVNTMTQNYEDANTYYRKSLDIRENESRENIVDNIKSRSLTLSNLAILASKQGEYDKAELYVNDALRLVSSLGERSKKHPFSFLSGTLHNQLGNIFIRNEKLDIAMQSYGDAVRVFSKEIKNRPSNIRVKVGYDGADCDQSENSINSSKSDKGENLEGRPSLEQLETHMQRTRHSIGLVLCMKGRLDEGMEVLRNVLAEKKRIFNKNGSDINSFAMDDPEAGKIMCDMSRIEILRGNMHDAKELINNALVVLRLSSKTKDITKYNDYIAEAQVIHTKICGETKRIDDIPLNSTKVAYKSV